MSQLTQRLQRGQPRNNKFRTSQRSVSPRRTVRNKLNKKVEEEEINIPDALKLEKHRIRFQKQLRSRIKELVNIRQKHSKELNKWTKKCQHLGDKCQSIQDVDETIFQLLQEANSINSNCIEQNNDLNEKFIQLYKSIPKKEPSKSLKDRLEYQNNMHLTTFPILFIIIIIFINFKKISSNSQFCSTLHTTTKQDKCPNPLSFDILKEHTKSVSSWKLNIPTLTNNNNINLIEEIKKRFNQGTSCPYIRQTNNTICCKGWQGVACNQPDKSLAQQSFATCHLWGRDHIRTFDGTYYQFPGSCTYKLIGSMTWQINIQFINCTTIKTSCEKKLTIVIAGKTLEIIGAKLSNLTAYPSSLTIRRQEKNLLDLYFTNGIRLKIDQNQRIIIIQFEKNLLNDQTLSGLCGDYNHNQDDDLKLLTTGVITSVPVDFGNQWKLNRTCPDVPPVINNCSITPAIINECISLTNQSNIFQSCFEKIDPKYFYQACLNDICSALLGNKSSTNARCQALGAYVQECQEQNLHIQWRSKTGCSKRCSSRNMVYTECASLCPRTCRNPSSTSNQCHTQNTDCTPGCVCSNETVYDSFQEECVRIEQCTCRYNNIQYQPGDQVSIDCNDCKCDHGRWLCTNRTCPRTCLVLGNLNILTFDGKHYALMSTCNQVLVETNDQSNYLRITYTNPGKELNIQILNTKIIFRQNDVLINGNIRHTLPYQIDNVIIRRASTVFIEVRDIQSNVVVQFDSLTSRIYIKLQPSFVDRIRGLCGTFNYKTHDDFLTPNNVIETNLVTFANAYVASSCSIPKQQTDTCLHFPANEKNARIQCTNLLKHPIFSTCSPSIIDPTFFLTSCIRDLCVDQSSNHGDQVKCSVITALAHACALQGIIIDWMSNETLARTCQIINYGQCGTASRANYSECVSECQSSCTDIDLMPSSCINQCLPGCTCRSGQFYDEHSYVCRTQNECPCYESQSEQYIHPSHSLLIKTSIVSNCSCSNGSLQCTSFNKNQCSPTQIYSLNTTLCPRTCANYLSHYDCGLYGPGCTCPSGEIQLDSTLNQQKCLPIDQCPCQYNHQFYLENEQIIQNNHGCQNCTCQKGGLWLCKKISCSKTCTIFGDSHYQTFDGLYYNFPGQCQYILVKDSKNLFRILSQNIPCGSHGQICSKNILIEYNGVMIDLKRGRSILLNNIELLNYRNQPVKFGTIHIYQLGIYTIIKTNDFIVKWDEQTYIDITIQSNNEMFGLCGNNNDNFDDDLTSANGASQINIFDMAKSWQTSIQCTSINNQSITNDPCGDSIAHAQRRTWAKNQCDLIKIKASIKNNPFDICIDKMETSLIEKYYQACLYDACHADHGGDCESVCTVLSAFAMECRSIVKTSIIKWRTADRCPMQCDSGKIYMACGPLCPQSCFKGNDYDGCIADSSCIDGCFCPHGQVMDNNGQCIEPQRCPCLYNNNIYPQSSRIMMIKNETCHHECECQNGSFICNKNETSICLTTNCTSQQFTCQSDGQCIPLNWKCDGINDCQDGSDELKINCQNQCLNKKKIFQCSNQQCIDLIHRCDGLLDCRDGSDEVNCSYVTPCKGYECPISKLCIPKTWICDGTVDCGDEDNSDESGDCKFHQCDTLSGRYFQCRDNFNCLPIEKRCDGYKDCNDGSDELTCSLCTCTSSFSCLHTCQCIDSQRVCDGLLDCIDGTDELNCTANCEKDEYTCLNGKCLNRNFLCDGIRHCSKGEDETHPDCIVPFSTTSTPIPLKKSTTVLPKRIEPTCEIQSALVNDRFISKPEFSTPIIGSISDLNPDGKGIDFVVNTPSTPVSIILPLKQNVIIINLVKFQILRPSNVNQFRLTFLNKQKQSIGEYQILSTDSQQSLASPTINKFPIKTKFFKEIQFFKIEILDTDDNRPPKHVTLLFQACFKQTKILEQKNCTQIDAMNSRYTTRIIDKLGGTHPVNSTYGNLLQGYGGVTYNTSQAVIDIRLHKYILSRINEISIPDYLLNRTNVKKIIVELFDRYHKRLFWNKTTTMQVLINSKKKIHVRFIRISILETNDNFAPFNVTVSVKGCFYRKYTTKKHTKKYTKTTKTTTKSTCYRANALDPQYAHKIIGQFEGTQPLPGLSFVDFIKSSKIGVDYGIKSPIILIHFQSNVVGQLDEISLINSKNNIQKFQTDLFDFNNNLLFSNQTIYPETSIQIPSTSTNNPLFVSTIQITILNTIDDRPARGIILSIIGCFSTFPRIPTTTTTTTTVAPKTTTQTKKQPRKLECNRLELMNNSNIIIGITSQSPLTHGNLGQIGRIQQNGVTFSDLQPSIDIIFRSNILISLSSISIISPNTNLKRFRIELLNNENTIQYKIESSSMIINLESLPSILLAGIRLTFLQTNDHQPPKNILLSIQACVEEIFIQTSPTTTPALTTKKIYPKTTPITPDHCIDIDAMQEPYSKKTLAGISGANPQGTNSSLLDLIYGKSISFNENETEIVLFIIFKSNLFVYLKYVGLLSLSESNVKQIQIEYLDKNQLLIRKIFVDYSNNQTIIEPIEDVGSIKITIQETFDKKSAKNVRLSIRGCFGIQPSSTTTTIQPTISTTPTPCHHLNLMSNKSVATKVIDYIAGTNPNSSSIFDYFNSSILISYTTSSPKFIIVFKSNIYVELKSILITNQQTNIRKYQIDLIDYDQTILQTIIIDKQQNQSNINFYVPINALQITYLETIDGQTPRNILLTIDGCFGINLGMTTQITTTTTSRPPVLTTSRCHEIDMMNKVDSTILVDSITGTLPINHLNDYFNQTSLISYNTRKLPIIFLIIFKSTIYAEIQSVSLINSLTNIQRFRVDLIDDYKSIVQTIESNENLTINGLTEVGIAAIQITYLETKDNQAPKNIRLAIKGCFGILPQPRRTTPPPEIQSTTTTKAPRTTKSKCTILDAMSSENRNKLLESVSGNKSLELFSSDGLSLNSTYGSIDIAFKQGIISNIDNITIIGNKHNIKKYQITFFDINNGIIDERLLTTDQNEILSIDNVATIRILFLETIDNKMINGIKLSIRGCFFKIRNFKPTKSPTIKSTKPPGYCHSIDLMNKRYTNRLLNRIGGTLNLPEIYNSTQKENQSSFFILEFNSNIFIRNIQNISILTKNHHIEQISIELYNKNRQLLKRMNVSMFESIINTNLYQPIYPLHVKYFKVTILKGKINENITWSIIGCFDRIKKIRTIIKTLKFAWWTVSCIHSNILAGHYGYHVRKSLTPSITGTPLPIGGNFQNLMMNNLGISYSETQNPIIIEIDFPPGIIGRLYEVGIKSNNVYRIRVQLIEVPNGLLYTLTSPEYKKLDKKNTNPRLTGFPPVQSSGIRVILLDTIDDRPPRDVKIYTNGCFYKSSVKYTALPIIKPIKKTTQQLKTTSKPKCHYSQWTRWGRCSVSCGNGVQIRARNRFSDTGCNGTLMDYRMCQLQPCMCVLTKEFYMAATGQKVPADNIVGYLKGGKQAVHIGDILDTGAIVYTDNCLQFICSNIGLDMKNSTNCQHKCIYRSWSSWSLCQGHCGNKHGNGRQYRERLPLHILAGSHLCESQKEYRSCQTPPCFGSCILSSWSKWSPCSKECNLGIQKRSRYYLSLQPNCTDNLEEIRDCNPQCCQSKKKPTWSEWSPWGNCSQTCDGGERLRYRTCQNDTSQCKQQLTCEGSNKQIEPCNTEKCPNQVECTNGQIMSNCSNACGHTCNTLTCRSCNEPSICSPGCVCPDPLVLNAFGECVETNQCLCQTSDGKTNLVSGQSITDSNTCEDCSCLNGCLNCRPSSKICSTCLWSEWSQFGVCSDKCNGTQTRYRSRSCIGSKTEIEYDNQTCSTNETSYNKGCAQCSCNTTTGQEICHVRCAITPDICSNITNDPFAIYEYIPPTNGACCGSCNRTQKIEPCSVQELPSVRLSSGDCVSINPIARQQCLGRCISGMICRCCSPSKITMEQIPMKCRRTENNSTMIFIEEMSYAKINSCSCQACLTNF